ncbi:HD domain-containing protein [Bacillus sp. CFBP 13597]|nr:HD domain-containing protein [Bacillus sp. CFBP 13597]
MIETTQELICNLYKHCKVTTCHSFRVGNDLCGFGRYLGIENQEFLFILGALHDIGKLEIPQQLLNKKERLTELEYDEIMHHTVYGAQIVQSIPQFPSELSDAILFHHENFDGSGYYGKKGKNIPLLSRIIRIIDSYDTMLYGRIYQNPKDQYQIIQEIKSLSDIHYDKDLALSYTNFLETKACQLLL